MHYFSSMRTQKRIEQKNKRKTLNYLCALIFLFFFFAIYLLLFFSSCWVYCIDKSNLIQLFFIILFTALQWKLRLDSLSLLFIYFYLFFFLNGTIFHTWSTSFFFAQWCSFIYSCRAYIHAMSLKIQMCTFFIYTQYTIEKWKIKNNSNKVSGLSSKRTFIENNENKITFYLRLFFCFFVLLLFVFTFFLLLSLRNTL